MNPNRVQYRLALVVVIVVSITAIAAYTLLQLTDPASITRNLHAAARVSLSNPNPGILQSGVSLAGIQENLLSEEQHYISAYGEYEISKGSLAQVHAAASSVAADVRSEIRGLQNGLPGAAALRSAANRLLAAANSVDNASNVEEITADTPALFTAWQQIAEVSTQP